MRRPKPSRFADETPAARRRRAAAIRAALRRTYPDARCELDWSTPIELAVATLLSAQCTDKRVNLTTPALFRKYRAAADWAAVPRPVLEGEIRSTGFFRNKAKNIHALAQQLDARFGGRVPDDFDTLVQLPGIGRKTANLLMATLYGKPGLVVDTHFIRLSGRLGLTTHTHAVKIEFELRAIVPEAMDWAWQAVTAATRLEGTRLELQMLPWRLTCPACGRRWETQEMYEPCPCGESRPTPGGGYELALIGLEVDDPPDEAAGEPPADGDDDEAAVYHGHDSTSGG